MKDKRVFQRMNETAISLIKGLPSGNGDRDAIRGDTGDIARTMALLNVAMFDAVNGVLKKDQESNFDQVMVESLVFDETDRLPPEDAERFASGAAAGRTVLRTLFSDGDRRDLIDDAYRDIISDLSLTVSEKCDSETWGFSVAAQVLSDRQYDLPATTPEFQTRDGGFNRSWRAQYAAMEPMVMDRPSQFLPKPPPQSSSNEYFTALKEVQRIGCRVSEDRSKDETRAARAWNGGPNTSRPSGAWFEIAIIVADQQDMELKQTARLFCLLGLTICDCMVSSWDAKRTYDYWRPHDAIRLAAIDGNSKTEPDLSWLQFSRGIGGSPEFTSGTATFGGGASTILAKFFGSDNHSFTIDLQKDLPRDAVPEDERGERHYNSFSEAADEAGMSRIHNGIHYRFSNVAGREAGEKIAKYILDHHPVSD